MFNKRTNLDIDIGTMVRTRRAIIRTPTPSPSPEATPSVEEESSSPEQPPRSRRKQTSTSREEAPPEYDVTRFTSLENQEWYGARLLKEIIIEKHLAPEVDAHYKVSAAFARLGWENILQLPRYYYPNLVREFYANVEDKPGHRANKIVSWVRGKRVIIKKEAIGKFIRVKNDGEDMKLTKEFKACDPWLVEEAVTRLKGQYRDRGRSGKKIVYADSFEARYHLIFYLFAHNVVPKKSGKRELRNSDLYFLDKMIHGVGAQLTGIPLPSVIISYMRTTARMRPGDSCFGFPRLLSLLFEKLQVNVSTDKALTTKSIDEVTITLLRSLAILTDFGASLLQERAAGEASTSTHPPTHPQSRPEAQETEAQPTQPPPPPPSRSRWQEVLNAICCMETRVMERIDQQEQVITEKLERHDRRLRALEDHFQIRRSPTPTQTPIPGEGQAASVPEPRGDVDQEARAEVGGEEASELGGPSA